MKGQNDWYTGTNYYDNYREKEIIVQRKTIDVPTQQYIHEQVEMIYVLSGQGSIQINGCDYPATEGSFFCMYSHHFYHIHSIEKELEVVFVKFYIGLFIYMSWEKHPKHTNSMLMYDTCPMVTLAEMQKDDVKRLMLDLLKEKEEHRFGSMNMVAYKTLELHTYFCRYAYEHIGANKKDENEVWNTIEKIILTTGKNLVLNEISAEVNCSARSLNQKIKKACGYTFFQLQQFGKILNACALLHFPELTMEYISDLLDFSSTTAFYRVFVQHCRMTPREYQKSCIGNEKIALLGGGVAMQFLQYMHIHFMQDLSLDNLCEEFYIKPYRAKEIFENVFGMSFNNLLSEIRVCYAASFLKKGDYSVLEISSMCGFDSLSTFQRAFKSYMNQTPSQYRKLM